MGTSDSVPCVLVDKEDHPHAYGDKMSWALDNFP